MKALVPLTVIGSLLGVHSGLAESDKYHVTPIERAACEQDAVALCSSSTDEDSLLACMKQNRAQLSTWCSRAFETGLKRRHLS